MIHSMTAFARRSMEKSWGAATLEMRTVNHRYFELDLRLPEALRELEMPLRESASRYLWRGKIDCHLKYKLAEKEGHGFSINTLLVKQLSEAGIAVNQIWGEKLPASLTEVLTWPGVVLPLEVDKESLHHDILALFNEALLDIVSARSREGLALGQRISERLDQILHEVEVIKSRVPQVILHHREKIHARMQELQLTFEPKRLEEELLMLIQKMDVAEEVDRLQIHVEEVRQTLTNEGAVGRRLDFLMQELLREANTVGSKSADAVLTHAVIHLKVLIEQMREQVQNIE